ncbi:MAG: Rrf2 family transcriptional regulator [Bacillota bacterium]|nr:Rrf2 family transcriptional regulator [Bacillota bacterium]
MKLTTKFRYGTRAILDLAIHSTARPVSVKDIAKRQDISPKYLENLFSILQTSGMIHSVRGAQGGYQLIINPAEITLKNLYELFEGAGCLVDCTNNPSSCRRSEICVTQEIWSELYEQCSSFLDSVTIKDLMERAYVKESVPNIYHI